MRGFATRWGEREAGGCISCEPLGFRRIGVCGVLWVHSLGVCIVVC